MPYLAIDDYKSGLDARKSVLTAPAGSLTKLINAAVTPGGEIEKRKAFVKVADLTGTTGLASIGNKVVAFTNAAKTAPDLGMTTASLEYHTLPNFNPAAKMTDYEIFDGSIYAVFYDPSAPSAASKNPHYYFDNATTTGNDGYTPAKAYVQTEGSGKGYYIRSFQSKMYAVTGKYIYFSAIKYPKLWGEATEFPPSGATPVSVLPVQGVANERVLLKATKKTYRWDVNANGIGNWVEEATTAADLTWINESTQRTGCGYINTSLQESGGLGLQGIEIYFDKLAVMSEETTQLWAMDPDPDQNALSQVIRANGTRAPKSVSQYGSGDVLYLATSGLRSLKARDASNSAAVTDIGSPIDNVIKEVGKTSGTTYLKNCTGINEPITGRFWAVFPDVIFVLSYYPGPKITAWSLYTVPFVIDYVVTAGDHVFIRSGNDLYLYGGKDMQTYDNTKVEIRFPYLDSGKPGHNKMFEALDATVEGTWSVAVSYNFDQPEAEEQIGTLTGPTWNKGRFALQGYNSHISMRFYSSWVGKATLANAAIHYSLGASED